MPYGSQNAFKTTLARKASRDRKKENYKSKGSSLIGKKTEELIFPEIPDIKLKVLKDNIRNKIKIERRKKSLKILIFTLIVLLTSALAIFNFFH